MQEEVKKHTKKIFDTAKNPQHTFGEKVKEILIEIFIIVFAVTLSIWLHSWSEHTHQQKEASEFLVDLKEDLKLDIKSMQTAKDSLSNNIDNFLYLEQLNSQKVDSLTSFRFGSSIGTTKINNGNYEGFKSSGKIGFIENKDLKKQILKYYQDSTPSVLEVEKINANQVLKITDFWAENAEKDFKKTVLSPKFKTMLNIFQNTAKNSLVLYEEAITVAKQIVAEIDKTNKS